MNAPRKTWLAKIHRKIIQEIHSRVKGVRGGGAGCVAGGGHQAKPRGQKSMGIVNQQRTERSGGDKQSQRTKNRKKIQIPRGIERRAATKSAQEDKEAYSRLTLSQVLARDFGQGRGQEGIWE